MYTTQRTWNSVVVFATLALLAAGSGRVGHCQYLQPGSEQQLLDVLRSDSPAAEKALACKNLAVHGGSAAVPELAKLLGDPQLSSWARIALEVIPGPEADEALRQASESVQGRQLIGVINSIGVRRDPQAVDTLATRLATADTEVASAAAVALGHIGTAPATKTLRGALATVPVPVRSAVAEGCILCAERLMADGEAAEAAAIYDEVRRADVPRQRIQEATRGAILARGQEGIPLLLEQLASDDKGLQQIALSTAREFPGGDIDKALAAELERAAPAKAALMIYAMADRVNTVDVTAIMQAAGRAAKPVRLAALDALGRVGDAACVAPLLDVALETDAEIAASAKLALANIPDDRVNEELLARLPSAEGKTLGLLIELVGVRRLSAVAALVKALDNRDGGIRSAALTALGATVPPQDLKILIAQTITPKFADDGLIAHQALKAAAVRMPDREQCATEIAAALPRATEATQGGLLEILAAVGGTKSLETVGAAAKSDSPLLQDVSSRLLGEWMTIDAAPVLLDLAKSAPGEKYQVRAMRGYIRIARQFNMSPAERVAMCQKAMAATQQPAEQKLVLDVLKRYPNPAMLKLALKAMENPALKDEATDTALAIAQKLGGNEVRELLTAAGLEPVKLEILKAEYGAGSTLKDVTEIVRKQAADLQLITLASPSYNEAFGGDPVPGTAKQLTIRYRINGQNGVVSFAENALIILPMPK